jgi:methylated-DNA-[protein]-cysteine S-methyltransferase
MMETAQLLMPSPLGPLLLETDGHAITRIHFCDTEPMVAAGSHALLLHARHSLNLYFDGHLQVFDFPIAQTGTEFQQRVWHTLGDITFGQTLSYKGLALRLGDEKCIRAAGTANGKNQIAIAVPCHRVIGSGGALVGYAGGLWRKKWLLTHEAKICGQPVQSVLF